MRAWPGGRNRFWAGTALAAAAAALSSCSTATNWQCSAPNGKYQQQRMVISEGRTSLSGGFHCVGGMSAFAGGVALRFRERDFEPAPEIVGGSGAEWPYRYADLAPHHDEVERVLGVAGSIGEDPTEPPRSGPYPQPPAPLAGLSRLYHDAHWATDVLAGAAIGTLFGLGTVALHSE